MDKDIYAKDCPILTGTCYTIKYYSGTKEKGCDAVGCPSAIAKAKWYGGKYTCCDSDLCNGPHHPPQQQLS
ncbi:hypothetical protein AAVH_29947 [Aphelenchoides avenae]|nr:hypothetical protein AAVH_29947 [Aphelenchus avenae]